MKTFQELRSEINRMDSAQDLQLSEFLMLTRLNRMWFDNTGEYMDANESLACLRQLTTFVNEVYSVVVHPDLRFMQVAPMTQRPDDGSKKIGWYVNETMGAMKILANGARDLPELNQNMTDRTVDVQLAGARVTWTWEDLAAAVKLGQNLPADGGMLGRQAADLFHEATTATGDRQFKLGGMLSKPSDLTAYNSGSSISWSGISTVQGKIDKLVDIINTSNTATGERFAANTLLAPPTLYRELEQTKYGDTAQYSTMLDYIEWIYRRRGFKVIDWAKLQNLKTTGIATKDVVLAFPFRLDVVENMIINPFFMKPPKENDNYDVSSGVYTKSAGIIWRQPKAATYAVLN